MKILALTIFALTAAFQSNAYAATAKSTETRTYVPLYERLKPQWGIHLSVAIPQIGNQKFATPGPANYNQLPFNLAFEAQTVTSAGVLGLGPAFGFYPTSLNQDAVESDRTNLVFAWSAGGQIRYQAKFAAAQAIVPTVAYHFESLNYRLRSSATGTLLANGPSVGIWIYLNALDPYAANQLYNDKKIARTFVTSELRMLSGSSNKEGVTLSGHAYHFGLRVEL